MNRMIQEILDCSLIKKQFLMSPTEQIISFCNREKNLEKFCTCICKIITENDFFLSDDILIEKLDDFVYYTRFSNKHTKEVVSLENQIILKLRQYKKMNHYEKQQARNRFIHEEVINRDLSFLYDNSSSMSTIHEFISCDYDCISSLINQNYQKFNYVAFCSTINLLKNKYPKVLLENSELSDYILNIINFIRTTKCYSNPLIELLCQTRVKTTERNLETLLYEESYQKQKKKD